MPPAISRSSGLRAQLFFDREAGSRLGITPAFISQTLYDAFGQRQISTIFTQLNQYCVILEVEPQLRIIQATCASCSSGRASQPLRRPARIPAW